MAAATNVQVRQGTDQFRGLFSDTWSVSATLDTANVSSGASTTDTVAVPGVAFGDMVIGLSTGISEAGLGRRAYVSAAGVITIVTDNLSGSAVDLAATRIRLAIVRPL